jgi:hypothetical protein
MTQDKKFFNWNITATLALIAAVASVVHFMYKSYVMPTVSYEQEQSVKVLKGTYYSLRDNFIDFVMLTLGMTDPHQTMLINEETVEKGVRCARYSQAMRALHNYLLEKKIIEEKEAEKEDSIHNNASYCILMARVILFYTIYNSAKIDTLTENEIIRWLDLHEKIVRDDGKTKKYLRYNKALRGLLYMEQAKKAADKLEINTKEVKELLAKSIGLYQEAIELAQAYPDSGEDPRAEWSKALSGVIVNYELQYLITNDSTSYREMIKRAKGGLKELPPHPTEQDIAKNFTNYVNSAEIHIMEEELNEADVILKVTKVWCDKYEGRIKELPDEDENRSKFLYIKGLEMYSRILQLLDSPFRVESLTLKNIESDINKYDLFKSGYAKDLLKSAFELLRARYYHDGGNDPTAKEIYKSVLSNICDNYAKWVGPKGYSGPRVLIKKFKERVITRDYL